MATTCKLIAKNVLGSDTATVTFSSIPGTGYTDLLVVCSARTSYASTIDGINLRFNGASTNYSCRRIYGTGSSVFSSTDPSAPSYLFVGDAVGTNATASTFSNNVIYVPNYAGSTNKSVSVETVAENNGTAGQQHAIAGLWADTAAITSIALYSYYGANFKSGSSFHLYGITKA